MKKIRNALVTCLFGATVALTVLGVLPTDARAATPSGCVAYGCPGGPDLCMTITVKYEKVVITLKCYNTAVRRTV